MYESSRKLNRHGEQLYYKKCRFCGINGADAGFLIHTELLRKMCDHCVFIRESKRLKDKWRWVSLVWPNRIR